MGRIGPCRARFHRPSLPDTSFGAFRHAVDKKIIDVTALANVVESVLSAAGSLNLDGPSSSAAVGYSGVPLAAENMTLADIAGHMHVVSAFDVPRCVYSSQKKTFERCESHSSHSLLFQSDRPTDRRCCSAAKRNLETV